MNHFLLASSVRLTAAITIVGCCHGREVVFANRDILKELSASPGLLVDAPGRLDPMRNRWGAYVVPPTTNNASISFRRAPNCATNIVALGAHHERLLLVKG